MKTRQISHTIKLEKKYNDAEKHNAIIGSIGDKMLFYSCRQKSGGFSFCKFSHEGVSAFCSFATRVSISHALPLLSGQKKMKIQDFSILNNICIIKEYRSLIDFQDNILKDLESNSEFAIFMDFLKTIKHSSTLWTK